ncbi:MAG: hypothetical protein ACK56I_34695, partial [bacterium]
RVAARAEPHGEARERRARHDGEVREHEEPVPRVADGPEDAEVGAGIERLSLRVLLDPGEERDAGEAHEHDVPERERLLLERLGERDRLRDPIGLEGLLGQ